MRCRIGAHLAAADESDQRDKQDHDREEEQQEQKQHVQQKIAEEAALPVPDVASDPQDDKDELNGDQDDGSPDASSFIQIAGNQRRPCDKGGDDDREDDGQDKGHAAQRQKRSDAVTAGSIVDDAAKCASRQRAV